MSQESSLWSSSPSQIINLNNYLLGSAICIAIIIGGCFFAPLFFTLIAPIAWMVWKYLCVHCQKYELTSERIRVREGVLNQRVDEIELYRIKDSSVELPFWMRLLKLGSLVLVTSDRSMPKLEIKAIKDVDKVRDMLRLNVERLRDLKRVREVDFEDDDDAFEDEFI